MLVVWDKIKEAWSALVAAVPSTSPPPSVNGSGSLRGTTEDRFALEDHAHNHGALGYYDLGTPGRMHTLAVADAADGFMSAAAMGVVASLGRGVSTSTGAPDAGKVALLNGAGKLDASFLQSAGTTIVAVTIDFGTVGVRSKMFTVAVSGATLGQKVIATPALDMPAGLDDDELEMDMITCAARVSATNTVRIAVASLGGPITGQRPINLVIG